MLPGKLNNRRFLFLFEDQQRLKLLLFME